MQSKSVPDRHQQSIFSPIPQDLTDNDPNDQAPPPANHSLVHDIRDDIVSRLQMQPPSWKFKVSASWTRNKGLAMVVLSQLFGTVMNVITRLLERDSEGAPGMNPFQILFARMAGTLVLSFTYQWLAKVKDAPFGPREVWGLLMARGFGGFFGVYGMYYSLKYLNLSDATVITFLAPTVACLACSILIKEPFTRSEQVAAVVSFFGVVLIARPASLFSGSAGGSLAAGETDGITAFGNGTIPLNNAGGQVVTSHQRLGAVGWALLGVLGAACAYTTIRWIGQRAHPLISVTYFASWTTIVSFAALCIVPGVDFRLPTGVVQWSYLLTLGTCGFVMQYLLTQGLAYEKSSRATNMVYTQMLFALAFDKFVWNETPSITSVFGSSLILASAVYVAVSGSKAKENQIVVTQELDEELGMLDGHDDNDSSGNDDQNDSK